MHAYIHTYIHRPRVSAACITISQCRYGKTPFGEDALSTALSRNRPRKAEDNSFSHSALVADMAAFAKPVSRACGCVRAPGGT